MGESQTSLLLKVLLILNLKKKKKNAVCVWGGDNFLM